MPTHDPIDVITSLGIRVIWLDDFDHRVSLIHDLGLVIIDPRVERCSAASAALDLLASSGSRGGMFEAS